MLKKKTVRDRDAARHGDHGVDGLRWDPALAPAHTQRPRSSQRRDQPPAAQQLAASLRTTSASAQELTGTVWKWTTRCSTTTRAQRPMIPNKYLLEFLPQGTRGHHGGLQPSRRHVYD